MPVTSSEKVAHAHPAVMFVLCAWHIDLPSAGRRSKRLCLGVLACILLPFVHLFLELAGFLLVDK